MIPASQIVAEATIEAGECPFNTGEDEGLCTLGYQVGGVHGMGHTDFHLSLAIQRALRRVAGEAWKAAEKHAWSVRLAVENQQQDKTDWPDDKATTLDRLCGPDGGTNA